MDDPKEEFAVGRWVVGVGERNLGVVGRIVESVPGIRLIVQSEDRRRGEIACEWFRAQMLWEITDSPDVAPDYRYQLLQDDDV